MCVCAHVCSRAGKEVANEEENRNATREWVFKKETKAAEVNGILLLFLFLFSFFFLTGLNWNPIRRCSASCYYISARSRSTWVEINVVTDTTLFFYCILSTFKSSFFNYSVCIYPGHRVPTLHYDVHNHLFHHEN